MVPRFSGALVVLRLPSCSTTGGDGARCAASVGHVGLLLAGLVSWKAEVRRRCRTVLQSRIEALLGDSQPDSQSPANAHPTLALV